MSFACVLRELGDGTGPQYVPASTETSLVVGERAFVARWHVVVERHGPSGSDSRSVCTPASKVTEMRVSSDRKIVSLDDVCAHEGCAAVH